MAGRCAARRWCRPTASTKAVRSRGVARTQQSHEFKAGGSKATVCPGVLGVPLGGGTLAGASPSSPVTKSPGAEVAGRGGDHASAAGVATGRMI